jgi:hypothetical protein
MGLPSSPLALSPAFLAMLQARHAPSSVPGAATAAPPAAARPDAQPASPSSVTGRGRLVDILV